MKYEYFNTLNLQQVNILQILSLLKKKIGGVIPERRETF